MTIIIILITISLTVNIFLGPNLLSRVGHLHSRSTSYLKKKKEKKLYMGTEAPTAIPQTTRHGLFL